ncbi:TrmH family RNA methyltransferase [Solicola gregarius]|uniref:RNA methyltransferase n=1 Tax=Solicola gregarius TaxID=2908642 RepID=A0AA46TH73_9ACTN|nr:RNA methyltransferase [Solicola gregarius]UYM05215.1 RNA methyltransferase [Solicola gregarius]
MTRRPDAEPPTPEPLTPTTGRVKRLRRLGTRTYRQQRREFLAEGPRAVRESLGRPGTVLEVFATAAAYDRYLAADATPCTVVDDGVIAALSDTVHPQGIVAHCRFVDEPVAEITARSPRLTAICADVRDPGNAGTVIRCADAAGADAVLFGGHSVDPYNAKAVRASVGSIFHVGIGVDADLVRLVADVRAQGVQVLAADGSGSSDLFALDRSGALRRPTAWLFGNEAWGLPDEVRALADDVVSVPIYGRAESLNLATAAAVCLYTSARAQQVH